MKKALAIVKQAKIGYINVYYNKQYIDEAIKELEELQNRSCINCKYSSVRFNIDCNLINKLDLPENFCCNKWENKA